MSKVSSDAMRALLECTVNWSRKKLQNSDLVLVLSEQSGVPIDEIVDQVEAARTSDQESPVANDDEGKNYADAIELIAGFAGVSHMNSTRMASLPSVKVLAKSFGISTEKAASDVKTWIKSGACQASLCPFFKKWIERVARFPSPSDRRIFSHHIASCYSVDVDFVIERVKREQERIA